MDFHILTYIIIIGTCITVPALVFGTYYYSGASIKKSLTITGGVVVWGILMYVTCRYLQFNFSSPIAVPLFLIFNLTWPSLLVSVYRDYFVGSGLSLAWLTGLQIFRNIGALFLLENLRGTVGTVFAFAAGLGDIVVGMIACTLFIQLITGSRPSNMAFYFLISVGIIDFLSAFTFGFLSSPIPFQLFSFTETHAVNLYPLGLIPFFLVPLAMAYHWLMFWTLQKGVR